MSTTASHTDAPPRLGVGAELQFLVRSSEKPRTYTFDPPDGGLRSNAHYAPQRVRISDARRDAAAFTLDREGFAFVQHASAVRDFWNEDEVRQVYYPEAERLIREHTGADRVFVFDHTLRRRVPEAEDRAAGLPRQPATRVHVDQTLKSGPQRVRDLLPDEADALLRGRVQIINLWRPIVGPLWDSPLALCDARTVDFEDLVASDLIFPDRVGETYAVTYNPAQHWSYVPGMTPSEALLIKCYDSADDGRARFAPHTAFIDPDAPWDAPPRQSIELRTLVFHSEAP
jgi:hypothetical protein